MSIRNIKKVRQSRRDWYAKNQQHAISKIKERRSILKEWIQEFKKI
jgi:hypothetical protein